MKKIVIKSVVITLILIIAFTCVFSLVICSFFPKIASNLSKNVGNYELSTTFSEKAYQKDSSTENLVDLVEKSIMAKNDNKIAKYAGVLLVDEDFRNNILPNKDSGYLSHISSTYVSSLYNLEEYDLAITTAFTHTSFLVDDMNAVKVLIIICDEDGNITMLNQIKAKLESLQPQNEIIINYTSVVEQIINGN